MLTPLPDQGLIFLGVLDDGLASLEYGEDQGRLSDDAPSSIDEL